MQLRDEICGTLKQPRLLFAPQTEGKALLLKTPTQLPGWRRGAGAYLESSP